MKTTRILLAVFVIGFLTAASVQAQGRINFVNNSATPILVTEYPGYPVTNILGTASTALFGFGPASTEIRLYAGLTSSSLSPVLIGTAANQPFVVNTASGIASAQGTFPGGSNLVLPGFDGSVPVFLQFTARRAFPLSDYYGQSPIIQVSLATGVATATQLFSAAPTASQWNSLVMYYNAPEPSALALVGMSFSMMFLARRRK